MGRYSSRMPLEQKLALVATMICLVLFIAAFVCKCCGGINWEFSEGSRSGVIQKLSKKGVIWKTWEGELNLGYNQSNVDENGHQTIAPAMFYFSVEDEQVAKLLKAAEIAGRRVTIDYKQYVLRGWDKGATSYDATDVHDATSKAELQYDSFNCQRERMQTEKKSTAPLAENSIALSLTDRQRVAMQYPCWRATEALHRRYFDRDGNWSTALTINK